MFCRFDYPFSAYFSSDCTQLRSVQLFIKAYYYYYYYYYRERFRPHFSLPLHALSPFLPSLQFLPYSFLLFYPQSPSLLYSSFLTSFGKRDVRGPPDGIFGNS